MLDCVAIPSRRGVARRAGVCRTVNKTNGMSHCQYDKHSVAGTFIISLKQSKKRPSQPSVSQYHLPIKVHYNPNQTFNKIFASGQ